LSAEVKEVRPIADDLSAVAIKLRISHTGRNDRCPFVGGITTKSAALMHGPTSYSFTWIYRVPIIVDLSGQVLYNLIGESRTLSDLSPRKVFDNGEKEPSKEAKGLQKTVPG
jgi:hypothetical protein